jgi:hypothetical protein
MKLAAREGSVRLMNLDGATLRWKGAISKLIKPLVPIYSGYSKSKNPDLLAGVVVVRRTLRNSEQRS